MNTSSTRILLEQHVPPLAVDYCWQLWKDLPFDFKTKKSRQTKVGDFTYRAGQIQQITVNNDLHPYIFLMTYIHEVAHLRVHHQYGTRVAGHGIEWKKMFQHLMLPVLNESIFPKPLLEIIKKHLANPKASSYSDPDLTMAFKELSESADSSIFLSALPEGSTFEWRGMWFKKGKTKRTRALCVNLKSKKNYWVPLLLEVTGGQLAF